nr:hypothetical protein [Tanacetum cinerariifolium]
MFIDITIRVSNASSLINLRVAFHAINDRRLPLALLVYTLVRPSVMSRRGFFKKQKLTEPNFIDWYRQLRIMLSIEDKLNYLEQPISPVPVALAGQQVTLEILTAHTAWVKRSKEIQAKQELLQTMRDFHSYRQEESQSVSSYVLKMKGYIDNLERLGHLVTLGLGVSLILIGLRKEYDGFVQNYNMHKMGKTVNELHAMLNLHEQTLPKSNTLALNAIRAGKVQKGNKYKKSHCQKGAKGQNQGKGKFIPKPKIPPPPKKENPAKDSIYHECLRARRKLKPGALSLYVGNGQREAVEAIGTFYLCLPSGLEIVLNNCHYAPSITRGVISVSRLYEDGFVNRFVDNTIQVSRNNVVYFCAIPRDGIFEIDLSNSLTNESSVYAVSNKRAKLDLDILVRNALRSCNMVGFSIHLTLQHLKNVSLEVENQLGKTIKSLRSDRGGEYMSQEFLDHLKDHGIIAHRTPLYTSQHNGVSERRNRTLPDMVRSMMSQTTLPKSFWDYVLETAASILNMVLTKKIEKTPYEVWHGKAPKLSYLKSGVVRHLLSEILLPSLTS